MGTWGSGNFENDTAADFLSEYTSELIDEIINVIDNEEEIEPTEYEGEVLPCKIEILTMITQKKYVGCICPTVNLVENWMVQYLKVYDNFYSSDIEYKDFNLKRRKVIKNTFLEYILAIELYNN